MQNYIDHFIKYGWVLFDLIDTKEVLEAREALTSKLCELLGKNETLENYHHSVDDDDFHSDIQYKLTMFYRDSGFAKKIIAKQKAFFEKLVGVDLLVQRKPYLRIARPNMPQDNIGYHRDTFYGGSPYEISVLIPYVDISAEGTLSVLSGSHTKSEDEYPVKKIQNPDAKVFKGSQKHQMGFLYVPKLMDPSIGEKMIPIPLKIGQALIFSLSTVHGSVVNQSKQTRWSTDIRVLNSLAPVDLSARPDYYEPLSLSPVTSCAQEYFTANV